KDVSKRFLVYLHDCKVCYKVFPLPLSSVSGTLDVRADTWEFRDFVGHYKGGVIRASGQSKPMDAAPSGSVARRSLPPPEAVRRAGYNEEAESKATGARVS